MSAMYPLPPSYYPPTLPSFILPPFYPSLPPTIFLPLSPSFSLPPYYLPALSLPPYYLPALLPPSYVLLPSLSHHPPILLSLPSSLL